MKKINKQSILIAVALLSVVSLSNTNIVMADGPSKVDLGTAGDFVILSKTGISTTGSTLIVGDIGVSPVAASYITGFALMLPTASDFSTSALITGKVYASDYASPTPVKLTTAISDMETAYTDASGRSNPTATELGAGNIGGLTITPGFYKWGTGVTIPSDLTISGASNDVWIFQIAQSLDVSSGVNIKLAGGAQGSNVFWVVAGQTTISTNAVFNGNILGKTAIVLKTGAKLNGKALAQTAVTLDANAVKGSISSSASSAPAPTSSSTDTSSSDNDEEDDSDNDASSDSSDTPSSEDETTTVSENLKAALQEKLNGLVAKLKVLQAQKAAQGSAFGQQVRSIAVDLSNGNSGNEVKILQEFLISQNKGPASKSLADASATGYFGVLTRGALAEFQASVGVLPSSGYFGPITRAHVRTNF